VDGCAVARKRERLEHRRLRARCQRGDAVRPLQRGVS
jgi:hypothetical protein